MVGRVVSMPNGALVAVVCRRLEKSDGAALGSVDGEVVGNKDGLCVGKSDGWSELYCAALVGASVGGLEGPSDGARLGIIMGMELMPCTATAVDSTAVGGREGAELGKVDGATVGRRDGEVVGNIDGLCDGKSDG